MAICSATRRKSNRISALKSGTAKSLCAAFKSVRNGSRKRIRKIKSGAPFDFLIGGGHREFNRGGTVFETGDGVNVTRGISEGHTLGRNATCCVLANVTSR